MDNVQIFNSNIKNMSSTLLILKFISFVISIFLITHFSKFDPPPPPQLFFEAIFNIVLVQGSPLCEECEGNGYSVIIVQLDSGMGSAVNITCILIFQRLLLL